MFRFYILWVICPWPQFALHDMCNEYKLCLIVMLTACLLDISLIDLFSCVYVRFGEAEPGLLQNWVYNHTNLSQLRLSHTSPTTLQILSQKFILPSRRITTWIESLTHYLNLYIIIIYDIMIILIVFLLALVVHIENALWFPILLFLFTLL